MQITIAAIGRERTGPYRSLFEMFRARCPWPIELVEIPPGTAGAAARRRQQETLRLVRAAAGHDHVVSLDPAGRVLDSRAFAATLQRWRDEGTARICLLIGGPDGFEQAALPQIDLALAFGRMTWPHQLVRVMLAEQLYRASTILAGHPYHRS